jgi:hypothetical protein
VRVDGPLTAVRPERRKDVADSCPSDREFDPEIVSRTSPRTNEEEDLAGLLAES